MIEEQESRAINYMLNRALHLLLLQHMQLGTKARIISKLSGISLDLPQDLTGIFRLGMSLNQLIFEIIPLIKQRLRFQEEEAKQKITGGPIKGAMDWPETLAELAKIPKQLTYLKFYREFELPENLLTALTLLLVERDCLRAASILKSYSQRNPALRELSFSLARQFRKCYSLIDASLIQTPQLRDVLPHVKHYLDRPELIKHLEVLTELSVYSKPKICPGYILLLDWRRDFSKQLSLIQGESSQASLLDFPAGRLYQVFCSMELIDVLTELLKPSWIEYSRDWVSFGDFQEPMAAQIAQIQLGLNPSQLESSSSALPKILDLDGNPLAMKLERSSPDGLIRIQYSDGSSKLGMLNYEYSPGLDSFPIWITQLLAQLKEHGAFAGIMIFRKFWNQESQPTQLVSALDSSGGVILRNPEYILAFLNIEPLPELGAANHLALIKLVRMLILGS